MHLLRMCGLCARRDNDDPAQMMILYDPTVHYNIFPLSLSSLLQNLIFAQNSVIEQEIKIRIEQIT